VGIPKLAMAATPAVVRGKSLPCPYNRHLFDREKVKQKKAGSSDPAFLFRLEMGA